MGTDELLEKDKSKSTFNLEDLKRHLSHTIEKYYHDVNKVDTEWLLKDADVDEKANLEKEQSNGDDSLNKVERVKSNHTDNLIMPRMEQGISNANLNNIAKVKPTVSLDNADVALSRTMSQTLPAKPKQGDIKRRASVDARMLSSSPPPSAGGFFSRLKGKLSHRSEPQRSPLFKSDYTLGANIEDAPSLSLNNSNYKSISEELDSYDPGYPASTKSKYDDPRLDEYIKFYSQAQTRNRSSSLSENLCMHSLPKCDNKVNLQEGGGGVKSFFSRKSVPPSSSKRLDSVSPDSSMSCLSTPELGDTSKALSEFKKLKPLKRVAFHSSTFLIDPPQQIPSRKPRKGNVEVGPDGVLKINPLSDEDRKDIEKSMRGQGGGAVVGGMGTSERHSDESSPHTSEDKDDIKVNQHAKSFGIDTPMVHRQHKYTVPVKKMALDILYTRCCHLREILPIPAILKQIPKGSLAPLPTLQMRNPTPTLVEVQTFADFLRIAPIICVSLDGVQFTEQQFKIILAAMSAKKQLVKLSLRNTPINANGWFLLCWFLSRNRVLSRLDVTQCPSIYIPLHKKKKINVEKDLEGNVIERMKCNKDNRSDMDWELFTATIIARGGIEEIILTGCCIADNDIFEKFIKFAASLKTIKLGLAYNKLTVKQIKVTAEEWLPQTFARGIDLGFNDFSSSQYLNVFLDLVKKPELRVKMQNSSLNFLSLNCTGIVFSDKFKEFFSEFLLRIPKLFYLDLSNNPKLFGSPIQKDGQYVADPQLQSSIVSYFTSVMPLVKNLVRIQLENNNLTSDSLMMMAGILPFCKNLGYFSVLGNEINPTVATAFIIAVQSSSTLIKVEYDSDQLPDIFKEKLNLYTIKNMESLLASKDPDSKMNGNMKNSTLSDFTKKFNAFLDERISDKGFDSKSEKFKAFSKETEDILHAVNDVISQLLELQLSNKLSLDGKEALIRFIYIESCIQKGMKLLDPNSHIQDSTQSYAILSSLAAEDGKSKLDLKPELDSEQDSDYTVHESLSSDIQPHPSRLGITRSSSKTSLSELEREEGSVHKLSNLSTNLSAECNSSLPNMEELSGDEIRSLISELDFKDIQKLVTYMKNLKKSGKRLTDVFDYNLNPDGFEEAQIKDIKKIKDAFFDLKKKMANDDSNVTEAPEPTEGDQIDLIEKEKIGELFNEVINSSARYKSSH